MFLPAVFVQGMDRGHRRITRKKYGSVTNSIARKGSRGKFPLAESRGSASGGVWGNAPTVFRATNSKETANKGAGSEASLPVTSRVRRRAPQLHIRPLTYCRARWARPTSMRRDSFSTAGLFLLQRISPLRRRPEGFAGVPSGLLRIALLCLLIFIAAREIAPASAATLGHKNRRWKDIPILPAATLLAYFFSVPIAPVIRTAPEITASSIRMKERMNGTPSAPMVDVPPKISTRSSMRKLISVTR